MGSYTRSHLGPAEQAGSCALLFAAFSHFKELKALLQTFLAGQMGYLL